MLAAFTTELAGDEMVEAVLVPKPSPTSRFGYFKFCRKTGEFPEASAACCSIRHGASRACSSAR